VSNTITNTRNAPALDQIEVSIFGPGFGECILVHLGGARWIVVDSCMDRDRHKPAALAYFDEIGINPASAVELIAITHWDDDHVSGIDLIVEACPNAEFWCSEALRNPELLTLVDIKLTRADLKFTRGVSQIGRLIDLAGARFKFALSCMRIYQNPGAVPVEIWSLSPSQYENLLAKQRFGDLVRSLVGVQHRISDRKQNHAAMVLAVFIGPDQILLGADLEEPGDPRLGWSAIVADPNKPPTLMAKIFKIPHHGSETAHHPDSWKCLIANEPLTATTPYNKSVLLPKQSDVIRITALATSSYVTKRRPYRRRRRRQNVVEKLVPKSLRALTRVPGQIRFRKQIGASTGDWVVDLFDGADLLQNFNVP
jgi:hypothetical protein